MSQSVEGRPGVTPALTPPIQPIKHRSAGLVVKLIQTASITNQAIVVPCPSQFGRQYFHQFGELYRSVGFNPFPHSLHTGSKFLSCRASLHCRSAFSIFFPAKFKAKKIKPPIMVTSILSESQHLSFLFRHFLTKLGQPFLQCSLECHRFVSILKARYEVIRKAVHLCNAPDSLFAPLL